MLFGGPLPPVMITIFPFFLVMPQTSRAVRVLFFANGFGGSKMPQRLTGMDGPYFVGLLDNLIKKPKV